MRAGRTAVEVDEAFLPEAGALPHAEGRIELDRRRGESVLERGHIDDRLERRTWLALRLDRPIIARADHVEPALHGHDSAGVNLFDQHPARYFGKRTQGIIASSHRL